MPDQPQETSTAFSIGTLVFLVACAASLVGFLWVLFPEVPEALRSWAMSYGPDGVCCRSYELGEFLDWTREFRRVLLFFGALVAFIVYRIGVAAWRNDG